MPTPDDFDVLQDLKVWREATAGEAAVYADTDAELGLVEPVAVRPRPLTVAEHDLGGEA